ncbi:MAG: hypothetical protein JXB40_01230 [Candidatus Omnitrophica bacterium]|nr:hypothetical protein [Candidatus Omnitrophota bacterium]
MKKMVLAVMVISFVFSVSAFAQDGALGNLPNGKSPVKVYVGIVKNESGQHQLSEETFKKTLKESFSARKSVDFDVVDNPVESDVQVSAVIRKYEYLKRGPFNPSPGVATTLVDAAATLTHNYVEMTVDFAVISTRANQIAWTGIIDQYIKRVMTPEESVPLIFDKVSRAFIWKSFGASNSRGTAISHK